MSKIVITVTDTETGASKAVVLDPRAASAIFDASEIGLDGTEADGTPYTEVELMDAWTEVTNLQRFLREV